MRPMLQTNARNVRKLDSFMVLIFVVFTESRKELRIQIFFRRDRVRIDEDYNFDARFGSRSLVDKCASRLLPKFAFSANRSFYDGLIFSAELVWFSSGFVIRSFLNGRLL